MNTIEREVGIGLAYFHARDTKQMKENAAWQWAKEHWPEFLPDMDSETGKLLLHVARYARTQDGKRPNGRCRS